MDTAASHYKANRGGIPAGLRVRSPTDYFMTLQLLSACDLLVCSLVHAYCVCTTVRPCVTLQQTLFDLITSSEQCESAVSFPQGRV